MLIFVSQAPLKILTKPSKQEEYIMIRLNTHQVLDIVQHLNQLWNDLIGQLEI